MSGRGRISKELDEFTLSVAFYDSTDRGKNSPVDACFEAARSAKSAKSALAVARFFVALNPKACLESANAELDQIWVYHLDRLNGAQIPW